MLKAIELLKEYQSLNFGWNEGQLHYDIDKAIEELKKVQVENKRMGDILSPWVNIVIYTQKKKKKKKKKCTKDK